MDGGEGLRQKGWTLLTIILILIASWKCGTVATLTGQGDNQVIYLRIPAARILKDMGLTRDQYIRWYQVTLKDLCDKAGITMKLDIRNLAGIREGVLPERSPSELFPEEDIQGVK